jgi:hypothetical protein
MVNQSRNIIVKQITDLLPYIKNARTHSDEQIAQISSSIKEFGFTNPILITGDGSIIAGHGRVMAAKKLKLTEIPCIELNHLTEMQRQAYILADNKLALNAGWDDNLLALELKDLEYQGYDLSLIGFSDKELGSLLDIAAADGIYSNKITVPTYEPRNKKPPIVDLYDQEKAMSLISDIKDSKLQQTEKDFLMAAASRHIVFNYSNIADFYSHSSKECQELMEQSALVIVDYKQAIENGFVHLTAQIDDLNVAE